MSGQQLTSLATAVDDVDDTGREALLDQGSKGQRSKRCFLRWLVDDGVTGCQCRLAHALVDRKEELGTSLQQLSRQTERPIHSMHQCLRIPQ